MQRDERVNTVISEAMKALVDLNITDFFHFRTKDISMSSFQDEVKSDILYTHYVCVVCLILEGFRTSDPGLEASKLDPNVRFV